MPEARRPASSIADLATRAAIELGTLRIEPSTLSLRGPEAQASLEPRVMQVLVALVDAEGVVTSREALLATCWGGAVVGDDALHRAVAGARRALRDAGAVELTIETIPKVGYRLVSTAPPGGTAPPRPTPEIATALPESAAAPAAEADPAPQAGLAAAAGGAAEAGFPAAPGEPAAPRRRALALGAVAVLGGALAVVWQRQRPGAVSADVSALIAQGRRQMRLATPEAERQAASYFEQATRLDARHPPSWGLHALALQHLSVAAPPDQLNDRLAAVEASAARALALDPDQPEALVARALLVPAFGEWSRAGKALQRVLDRDPSHPFALDAMAALLASTGMIDAHYPLRLRVVELDPFHAGFNFRSIYSHWMNGNVPAGDRAGERGLELWPRHLPTWLARHALFRYTGRATRALAMSEAAESRPPLPPWMGATLHAVATALASGQKVDRDAARGAVLQSLDGGGPLAAVGGTMDLAALGDTSTALDVTEAYLLERGPLVTGTAWKPGQAVHQDVRYRFTNHLFLPVTAPLRADPRFASITRDIGMAAHWERSGRPPDHLRGARA